MIRLTSNQITLDASAPDGTQSRTITGIAVPYGVPAVVSDGTEVIFEKGSLPIDGKKPRLYMNHDSAQAIGIVTERVETDEGMLFSAKISKTALGDDAIQLALDSVIDSVSVGVNVLKSRANDDGSLTVLKADWIELSMVPVPAFAGAIITDVAASIHQNEEQISHNQEVTQETEPTMQEVETPQVVEATIPTAPIPAVPKRQFDMPTAGEYLAAMHIGGTTFENVANAAREAINRKRTALQAAAGDVLTTDTPGLIPVPVLGPTFEDLNYIRPVVAAVGARAMPSGNMSKTFIRPTWTTHTSVGTQSTELSGVSATTPVIASNVVSKTTLAGQVTLSVQDIDFTDPGAMQIILNDLVGQYMLQSDNLAADGIVSGGAVSGITWTVNQNDPSSLITALYGAAVNILSATNFLPDTIFVSSNVWELLGRQLDAEKRPVFPYTGAAGLMGVNGMGTANVTVANTFNPFGLNLVADRNFAANTMVVARARAIEYYESVQGLRSVEVPSTLGRTFSYYGYASLFVADNTQVQKIALA